jgi:hypothetical protein
VGLTYLNLRVDGTNYALKVDDSDEFNAYKNLISAFMPFYQFDDNGTVKSTTTYDLILQTMKNVWEGGNPNNPNNNRSALDFLSSSAIGGYGFSQVVRAQWDKECVDLILFNRNLTYNQDFHAKHNLTINTLEDIPTEFLYDSDYLFNANTNQKSIALPVYQNSNFIIQDGVTAIITAGNFVSIKGEVYLQAGSEVSIQTVSSACYTGGRYASVNINLPDLADSINPITIVPNIDMQENYSSHRVIISPNPFNETLTIETTNVNHSYSYSLQNTMGQILETGISYSNKTILNLSNISKGIYVLKINFDENIHSTKLIKN